MTVINTNIKSLVSQNALQRNSRDLQTAMQQLSTGKRINSAADDAAGLAISSRMTSQIRGLDQAVRNANDGISLVQSAEGALVEVTNMLQRMRELAIQSANDTNSASDRAALDLEFRQLKAEINRVGETTQWNGMNILDGNDDFGTVAGNNQQVQLQVGANANQTINIQFKDFTFTAGTNTPTASVTTLDLSAISSGTDFAKFVGTFGAVTVNFAHGVSLSANPTVAEVSNLAAALQTNLRATAGLEHMQVEAQGEVITITDVTGAAASGIAYKTSADADATAAEVIIYANGTTTNASAPTGGVFSANLAGADITSASTANNAIGFIDVAIQSLNNERAMMGATINRLTYTGDNLSNVSLNTNASRSRILDTDYAKASSELSRTQIIQQAATAVLAQANVDQQSVLKLLQG